MRLVDLERIANRKMWKLAELYVRVPEKKRRLAFKIYLDLGDEKLSYEEALRRLKELAHS